MNWKQIMIDSLNELLNDGFEIFGNKEKAVEYAKKNTSASDVLFETVSKDFLK